MNGRTQWIASYAVAPTAKQADHIFHTRYERYNAKPAGVSRIDLAYGIAAFLSVKRTQAGERAMEGYNVYLNAFAAHVGERRLLAGIREPDFTAFFQTIAAKSPATRDHYVVAIKAMFAHAVGRKWIEPPDYGPVFRQPTRKECRIAKAKAGPRLYAASDIRAMIDRADPIMRACIYLGINAAMGPLEIARLRPDQLRDGVLYCPREKTGNDRTAPLWDETVKSIADAGGLPLATGCTERDRGIFRGFNAFARGAGVPAHGFYTLRRMFRTVVDELPDRPAIDLIMGHTTPGTGAQYVQRISPSRLRAVTDFVRSWLFAD